jgi:hypothetical protein
MKNIYMPARKKFKDMTQEELKVELERRQIKKRKHYKKGKAFGSAGAKIAGASAIAAGAMGGCNPNKPTTYPICAALGIGVGTGAVVSSVGAGFSGAGYLHKRKTKKIQKLLDKQAVASRGRKRKRRSRKYSKAYHAKQYKKAQKYQRRSKTASRKKKSYRRKKSKSKKKKSKR